MKKRLSALLIALLLALSLIPLTNVHAFSSRIDIQNIGEVDQNNSYTVAYSLIGDENMVFNGAVSISGGNLNGVTLDGGQTNGGNIVFNAGTTTTANGSISFTVTHPAELSITISGDMSSVTSLVKNPVSKTITLPVRSAERKAYEESVAASIAESIEASRREQERIDASIREEQERAAREERERQEAINRSIAESVSIEESIRESIYNQEMSSYWAQSEIEKSISIEESLADLTRAFEIDGKYFVPYTVESAAALPEGFLFAVADTDLNTPEEYIQKTLVINEQEVIAYQTADMDPAVYLVYGRFSEEEEPAFYFYNTKTNYFFPYDALSGHFDENATTESETESETETTEAPTTTTEAPTTAPTTVEESTEAPNWFSQLPNWKLILMGVLCLLGGAFLAFLIMLPFRRKKDKAQDTEAVVTDEAAAIDAEEEEALAAGDTDEIEADEAETAQIAAEDAETAQIGTEAAETMQIAADETETAQIPAEAEPAQLEDRMTADTAVDAEVEKTLVEGAAAVQVSETLMNDAKIEDEGMIDPEEADHIEELLDAIDNDLLELKEIDVSELGD
ncbi:MAG: hypothetical protein IJL43_04130 [Lachnospiraceae bacterium]|nr:hypothetical protein [Lachnospiraceae bacterium]